MQLMLPQLEQRLFPQAMVAQPNEMPLTLDSP